jgi:hypothetical protein
MELAMKRSRRWLLALVAAAGLAWPGMAAACGTLQDWIARYDNPQAGDAGRKGALMELAAFCGDYFGAASDRALLPVLGDALARGETALAQQVFERFRCLSAMPDEADRRVLAGRLDVAGCPSAEQRQHWRAVSGDGVNLRAGPARSAERLATLPRHSVVEVVENHGDWAKVTTFFGAQGYIHAPLLAALPAE